MILPIVAYGSPVLTQKAVAIPADYPGLLLLINDMFETMYNARGVGLAAPQVDLSIRLFIVDTAQIEHDEGDDDDSHSPDEEGIKQVFINPEIIDKTSKKYAYNEGCLSIPHIREDVTRPESIKIRYQDENFQTHETEFSGFAARVIQHEYDHIEGILFTDHLSVLKKQLIKKKLERISKGEVRTDYRMKFFNLKRR